MVDFIITATAGANGKISPEGNVNVKEGDDQEFKVDPANLYQVDTFLVDGAPATLAYGKYKFVNVVTTHTISVTFTDTVIIDGSKPVKIGDVILTSNPVFNELVVIVTPKSAGNGGFVICPECGATFGNILYIESTDTVTCLMCGWKEVIGDNNDPLAEIHKELKLAKPPKIPATP